MTALPGVTVPGTGLVIAPLPWRAPGDPGGDADVWLAIADGGQPPVAAAFARAPWLATVLPSPEQLARITDAATAARARAAWFYAWYRGDDLYVDAAWLLGPGVAMVRETFLGMSPGNHRFDAAGARPWRRSPLVEAMRHVRARARVQYLDPPR